MPRVYSFLWNTLWFLVLFVFFEWRFAWEVFSTLILYSLYLHWYKFSLDVINQLLVSASTIAKHNETVAKVNNVPFLKLLSHVWIIYLQKLRYPLFHWWVPMVFYCVISSAIQHLSHFSPLIADASVIEEQQPLLLGSPRNLLYFRIQVVVPPFTTLFPNTSRQVFSDLSPLLRAVSVDQVQDKSIFLISPGTFNKAGIQDLLPSMEALHVGSPVKWLCYPLPVSATVLLHCIAQSVVFIFSPVTLHESVVVWGLLVFSWTPLVEMLVQHLLSE